MPDRVAKIEKAAAWALGLATTALGAVSGATGLLPHSVDVTLIGVTGVLVAAERYVTAQSAKPSGGSPPVR